jgi:DNA polymerase I
MANQVDGPAENMGFEVLHGIVDCLWVIGEPISVFKEAVEKETGILTEVDTYDWITFLPMSDGTGAYSRYLGRLNTSKMKIRGVMARKGDTPEYVNEMQQ